MKIAASDATARSKVCAPNDGRPKNMGAAMRKLTTGLAVYSPAAVPGARHDLPLKFPKLSRGPGGSWRAPTRSAISMFSSKRIGISMLYGLLTQIGSHPS
jgi:hypothetical protein